MRSFHASILLLALAASSARFANAQAQPASAVGDLDAMNDKARELFKEGTKLYREQKWAQAEAAFEAAWSLTDKKSKGLVNNLGQTEMHLGKYREAAEHLTIARRLAAKDDKQLADIERDLAEAKKKVGTLTLQTNVDGAQILIGNKPLAQTPLLDPVYVEPGKLTITALKDGFSSAKIDVDVQAGQALPIALTLEKPTASVLPTITATASASAPPAPRSKVLPAIAFGVGGAGLIAGIVGGALALAGNDSLSRRCDAAGKCPSSARGEVDMTFAMSHLSTVGFALAGVGVAAGVTLLILPASEGPPRAAIHVSPGHIAVRGAF